MLVALQSKLYDKSQIDESKRLFSNKDLKILLIPLIIEQLLNSFMGMTDTLMVSNVGSAAISAVSLVDSINNLVIQVFSAMAAGATIVCSQYLGRGDEKNCNQAARQVFLAMLVISSVLMIIGIGNREWLLNTIFGKVEADVMENAMSYFFITVLSYPFLALFSAGSAFYRASGNSKFPMKIAVVSNLLNIVGNTIFIFGLHMGVAGAALSTLLSRIFCTVVIFYFLHKPMQPIILKNYFQIRPDFPMIGKVLSIGIPAGIENGMFQFGKLAIQSTVSALGTVAIAAQAMTNILESVNGIVGVGIGIGLMTVVGQCMGAGRKEEAKYYIVKLTAYAEIGIFLSCLFVLAITKPITFLGGMEAESARMCFEMMIAITIVKPMTWALSFVPAYGMRAAGDVKFSMVVATLTMWLCRVALCVYLCKVWGFGPIAVWIGMFADWTIRSIIFTTRFLSGKWAEKQVV
ncbi:MAG: MATE family efflux transporter [Candidatus Cellulosilyticum pullistercoris]|uniref:Probable multidrug resistance protein NorM n=1 Tax=Candidatus Cellulosilyticum pullistercoris TaxID=2838521 RepID=A0A9E2NMV8_9FIRM|nr:MATE family efflux transporter [Candidatus Cellulosilyticum pullistercoris]